MIKLYGIPNCDTVKATMAWLKKKKISFEFHDYKKAGISKEKLEQWLTVQPLDILLNKRSTTWKELTPAQQKKAGSQAGAVMLMQEYNNLIKRPVLEIPGTLLVGFNEAVYQKNFKQT